MILYVPTSGAPVAEQLTTALWALSVPPQHQGANVTSKLFGTVTAKDGSVWLQVDTEMTVLVHPDADPTGIAVILEPFVVAGAITELELLEIFDLVEVCKGQQLNIWECFPQYWMNLAKEKL
jgi:hypothetical protein